MTALILLLVPVLLLLGLLLIAGIGFAVVRSNGTMSNAGSWILGLGIGAAVAVGLGLLIVVSLFSIRSVRTTDVRVTPPVPITTPDAPAVPMHLQPVPPKPPLTVVHSDVALVPVGILGLLVLGGLVIGILVLATRPHSCGFSRGSWGPVVLVGLIVLVGAACLMWFIAIPLRAGANLRHAPVSWAEVMAAGGALILPVIAGIVAVVLLSIRPSVIRREAPASREVADHVPLWRRASHGLAVAILPAGVVWGGSLLALQATPKEAVDAIEGVVLRVRSPSIWNREESATERLRLPVPTDDRSQTAELPAWVRTAEVHSGSRQRLVLASRLYSSVAEGEHELLQETASLVRNDLRQHDPLALQARLQELPDDTLRTLVVTNQYTQSEETDFGNFAAPMQRVWWEVQIDDQTRDSLAKYVHQEVARNRLLVGVWALALVTLIVGCYLALIPRRRLTSPELPASLMTA